MKTKTTKTNKNNTAMMAECVGVKYDARTGKYSSVRGKRMVEKNEYYRVYMALKRKHAKTLTGKKSVKKINNKARKTIDRMIKTLKEIKELILAASDTVKVDLLALVESMAGTAKSIDAGNRKYARKTQAKAKAKMV